MPRRPRSGAAGCLLAVAVTVAASAVGAPPPVVATTASSTTPLVIDGLFRDWRGVPAADGDRFDDIRIAEGARYLYLHFRLPAVTILQADSDAALLVDTDGDPTTGRAAFGIGAEIEWRFGARTGFVHLGSRSIAVRPDQIGLVTAPTVSTVRVEMALDLDARVAGQRLFRGERVRGVLTTPLSLLGIEAVEDAFAYERGSRVVDEPEPLDIDRAPGALRVMNYNIEFDGLFEPSRESAYRRVFRAVDPDIVGFQEIFESPVQAAGALLDGWLPLDAGERWHTAAAGTDAALASRHPIVATWLITPGVDAYLVAPPDFGSDIVVIVASLKCCADPGQLRKSQIDAIQAFWRDAMSPGGTVTVGAETPMVMIGDMNLVGDAAELDALRRGRVFDDASGPDFDPDWDGSPLTDLRPLHTDQPMAYTWRRDDNSSQFSPGRLDFIFYTDSVLRALGGFVLHTPSMPGKRRKPHGLKRKDTVRASDHLPVVIDVVLR